MREEVRPLGVEIVTVCLETLGAQEGQPFVDAAAPTHPTLLDRAHQVDAAFGILNIPNAVWIDEHGQIVRPVEPAWPGPRDTAAGSALRDSGVERLSAIAGQAGAIVAWTADTYANAVRDWARNGAESPFVLSPEEVIARSGARNLDTSGAAAHFELAQHFERAGQHEQAVPHFRQAHALAPDNWTYKRQAWSLSGPEGPFKRFWQGPQEGQAWEYEGDWLHDITATGASNYYVETKPLVS